tara:strand:+ start:395 stop:556 length:162 start_codon:yes stop_codon:yes gene_type:complete
MQRKFRMKFKWGRDFKGRKSTTIIFIVVLSGKLYSITRLKLLTQGCGGEYVTT